MALPTGLKTAGGKAVAVVILVFMALLSFRGISTPSLSAQGEQRRPSFFNIRRDIPLAAPQDQARFSVLPRNSAHVLAARLTSRQGLNPRSTITVR